jgi:regulator of sigma E protease
MGTTLLSFVVVLGVLIFFHEFGHFLIARLFGVGVEKFSLGFGPRLIGKKIGRTDYRISAIPLGGYRCLFYPQTCGQTHVYRGRRSRV